MTSETALANTCTTRRAFCAAALILGLAPWAAPGPADVGPASQALESSAEDTLWRRIVAIQHTPATSQPFEQWFRAAERRDSVLRDQLRLYVTLYPGGRHRDEAIQLELASLFELGTLRAGDLTLLRIRVAEILRASPSPTAEEEAAYWQLVCEQSEPRTALPPTSQATTAPVRLLGVDLPAAYRGYIARYPRSRQVPRLATVLFEEAARRGDRDGMRAIVEQLGTHFPNHEATEAILGTWNRLESVGRPFWVVVRTVDEHTIDTREYVGHAVLVVIWAGFDDDARRRVQRVEQFRRAHPDVDAIGVSLDETADATQTAARALGTEWPQCNDGRGWGNEFARTWGVRYVPFVFVIDRAGQLAGATGGDEWEQLASQVWAQHAPPAESRPAQDGEP